MFQSGLQIGNYTLIRPLGRGGFGEVWLAERQAKFVKTKVAVKLPHAGQVDAESIKQEAVLWEQASGHPNVLPIIDADEYDGQIVIVSEYVEGGTLAEKLKRERKLSIKRAVEITIGVLSGLEYLHSKNIIHRDIKPANILLQGETPRLTDFGISRAANASISSSLIVGTEAYMSPEAFDGRRSPQGDIWAVGVMLYQMLAGKLPFSQEHLSERMYAIMTKEFEPLPADIPQRLREIIARALRKSPAERYPAAVEMRADLQKVLAKISYEELPPSSPSIEGIIIPPNQIDYSTNPVDERAGAAAAAVADSIQTAFNVPPTEPAAVAAALDAGQSYETRVNQSSARSTQKTEVLPSSQMSELLPTAARNLVQPQPKPTAAAKSKKALLVFSLGVAPLLIFVLAVVLLKVIPSTKEAARNITDPDAQLVPFKKGDFWGYADHNQKIIIQPQYDTVYRFSGAYAAVSKNGTWGFINKDNNFVSPPGVSIDHLYSFHGPLAKYEWQHKTGFLDGGLKPVIPAKYSEAWDFYDGRALFKHDNGKYGYLDKTGAEIISAQFDEARDFSDGYAAVMRDGKAGVIDVNGKFILPMIYEGVSDYGDWAFGVKQGGKWGFVNNNGKLFINFTYDWVGKFKDGLAPAELNGKYGFINLENKTVVNFLYDYAGPFTEGLAWVKSADPPGYGGFIDKTGKVVIPLKYKEYYIPEGFINGICRVRTADGILIYIDKSGKEYYDAAP